MACMRILFDNGTPRGLARLLTGHMVEEARWRQWDKLENGDLIAAAEDVGFDLIVTTDKNTRYQQNLSSRRIAILVLSNSQWPMVEMVASEIARHVDRATPGSYVEVTVPFQAPPYLP